MRCESGDAFDGDALAALSPSPEVAVVSGLLELFSDDALARRTPRGLARALPTGGLLVSTNQPWHPQVELIATTLENHVGEPWIMRCRSQVEMDALVEEADFEKLGTRATSQGLFTVSVARRCTEEGSPDTAPAAAAVGARSPAPRRPAGATKWI